MNNKELKTLLDLLYKFNDQLESNKDYYNKYKMDKDFKEILFNIEDIIINNIK